MKRINIRFVMITLVVLIVSGGIVYLVHGYQTDRYAEFFSERARQAEVEGRTVDAVQDLNLYLGLEPDDAQAQARLGILLADAGQYYAAFTTLERVLRQQDDTQARRKLVDVLVRMRRWRDARSHLDDRLLKATPDDPILLDRLAQCQWGSEEYKPARDSLVKAIEQDPHQTDSYLRLVGLLESQPEIVQPDAGGKPQDADYWRDRLAENNPQAATAFLPRARHKLGTALASVAAANGSEQALVTARETFQSALRDAEQALAQSREAGQLLKQVQDALGPKNNVARATELLPQIRDRIASLAQAEAAIRDALRALSGANDAQRALKSLAEVEKTVRSMEVESLWLATSSTLGLARARIGDPDAEQLKKARELARSAIEVEPQDERLYAALAEIELAARDRAAAMQWLRQGTEKITARTSLPVNLARMQMEDNQYAEARKTIQLLVERGSPKPLVDYLTARAEFADGKWQQAVELLSAARTKSADAPDLAKEIDCWLGRCYQKQGNVAKEIEAYRRALAIDPMHQMARGALGDALARQGRYDDALEQYRVIADQSPDAMIQKVRLAIATTIRLSPGQRNWDAIEKDLERLTGERPDDPTVRLLRVQLFLAEGRMDEATAVLGQLRAEHPDQVEYWVVSTDLATQQQKFDEAEKLLADAATAIGDVPQLRLTRARLVLRRDGDKAGPQIRPLADGADSFSEDDRVDFWNGLIPLSMACGDYEYAQELCRRLTELRPEDVNAWLQWLAIAVDQKDFATADNALAKVEQIDRGGPVTSYCRAAVLAARNKPAEALAEIKKTLADRPTWVPALRLAASQEEAEGQLESALEHSLAAIDAGTNDVDTYSRAIRLLYGRGQFDQAAKLLDRVGEQSISLDLNLQRLRLVVSGERNDLDLALRTAESIAADSKDHRDQVRLGLLFSARAARERGAGQEAVAEESLKKAEQVLRAAREQAPDAPETWTALLRLLVTNNRTAEAEQLLADAIVKFGAQGPSLDLAKCQLAAGHDDDAAKVYEALLASKPLAVDVVRQAAEFCLRSGRPQMAMEQLREIIAGRIAADKNNVIWCRRALAMALGEQASKTNLDEALRLVQQNLDVDPSSVLDRRTKAVLLSGQPQRAARQEAIQILEELLRSGTPGEAETRTRLGQLYLAMGDWDRALPHLRTSTDPSALIAFVRGSLQRKQFAEAEQGLNLLDKLPLGPSVTAILRAELLFQRGESDQSLQVLAEMVANAAESARANALLSAAVTAEGFAQSPQASSDKFTASCLDRAESYLRTRAELGANEQMDLAAFIARRHRYDEAIGILEQMSANAGVAEIARGISGFAGSPSPDPQVTRRIENVVAAALEKHKRPFALINSYIRLLVLWERWDEVEGLYREIIDRDAGNFTARNNLAELLALRGKNLDDALMLIQTALEFTGDVATLVDTRAVVYMARGQFDPAVRDMQFVIDGEPRPNRFFHLARAYDGANQPAAATKALKKAVELGLTSDQLHPLERSGFVELAKKLQ